MDTSIERISSTQETREYPDRARIRAFTDTLDGLANMRVVTFEFDFAERYPVKQAIDRFLLYDCEVAPTLYLHPDIGEFGQDSTLSFTPRMARSGKHSGHGVFFGDIDCGGGQQLPVAVKPHSVEGTNSCLTDYLNGCAVNDLGIFSLQPVGFILDRTGRKAYSLTYLEETLTTLDSVDWSDFYIHADQHPGMQETWLQAARLLALVHSNGSLNHGDFAPRNIATTADGGLLFIDWEEAEVSMAQPRDAEVRYGLSYKDLFVLAESFCRPATDDFKAGIGLFYGKGGDWWNGFREIFFDEYVAFRREMAEMGSHNSARRAAVDSELQELSRSLQGYLYTMQGNAATNSSG